MQRRQLLQGLAASACTGLPFGKAMAAAESYPNKPVKFIVAFLPGSAPDMLARSLTERLSRRLGQPFVVENRPGAGGNIGFSAIAKSPADGYNLGLGTSSLVINASLYKSVPFDPFKDFTPVASAFEMPQALIVRPDSELNSVADLIKMLKASPGKYTYASGGNGSGAHICTELFKLMSQTEAVHVPFRGGPEVATAVMAGTTTFGFPTLSTAVALGQAGRVKVLGTTGSQRNPALPNVPAVNETVPGFEAVLWTGIIAPPNMPAPIVRQLDSEVMAILADPAFRQKMQADGTEIVGVNHQDFSAYMRKDFDKWKKVIESSGAKVD